MDDDYTDLDLDISCRQAFESIIAGDSMGRCLSPRGKDGRYATRIDRFKWYVWQVCWQHRDEQFRALENELEICKLAAWANLQLHEGEVAELKARIESLESWAAEKATY